MKQQRQTVTIVAIVIAMTLFAGCGDVSEAHQPPAPDDVTSPSEEPEAVYTFPDGTEVYGEAAVWMQKPMTVYPFGVKDGTPITKDEAAEWEGGAVVVPQALPERFHFVRAFDIQDGVQSILYMEMADPHRKEKGLVLMADVAETGMHWTGDYKTPIQFSCTDVFADVGPPPEFEAKSDEHHAQDEVILYREVDERMDHICHSYLAMNDAIWAHWWLLNTPEAQAHEILHSAPVSWK